MDTLDSENMREETSNVTLPARDHLLVTRTQESGDVEMHRRSWFAHFGERIRYWFRASTFSPEWLNAPWNRPAMGYLAAILTTVGTMILTLLLGQVVPTFAFQGTLMILVILGVALLWGTGPGLFATLCGTILLTFFILPPRFFWTLSILEYIFETCLFLFVGIIISLVVSRIEHVRAEAVAARGKIEELVTQLEAEKEALSQAQQQSAERASEVEAIFEAIADGVYFYDAQGHLLRTNVAAQTFNPLTRQPDYQTGSFPDRFNFFLPRDENEQPFEPSNLPVSRVLRGETLTSSHTVDTYLRQRDGTDILLNVSGAPVRDEGGQIRGAVVVTRDMTERSHLEQRTREALDALLAMTQLIGQGFEHTDGTEDENREQTGLTAQEVTQRMAEFTRSFLGCRRLSISIVEPETGIMRPLAIVGLSPEQEQQWWKEQQQQESWFVERPDQTLIQRLQANEVVLFDMTQPPWDAYPNPYGISTMLIAPMSIREHLVGILTLDYGGAEHQYTSEGLALAGAVANLTATVIERDQLLRQRAEMRANELALRETNQRMDEFLGIVSHELRTPLTTIKGNVQLARLRLRSSLREVPADGDVLRSMLEEVQTMLARAERQVNVQNRMVGDLLDISRLEADKLELRLTPCDLATIVRETVEDQRSVTPTRTIHLELAEEETAPVIADAERVGQVLSNYLSNALKYSPANRPVHVHLKKEDSMVRVLVCDEGPGLTPSEQQRIWERFYQVQGIKRQRGSSVGLGLGLHICRAIVEQHQGEVGVESTKGEGSTFWFTLPLAVSNDEEVV
ncbi:MAG TPA: ATP-binding protein [Ktedonobacteraceae bacterium]